MGIDGPISKSEIRIPKSEAKASEHGNQNSDLETGAMCPACGSPRGDNSEYCIDCGLVFESFVPPPAIETPEPASSRLKGRYQLGELISTRGNVSRCKGLDFAAGTPQPLCVIILRGPPVID